MSPVAYGSVLLSFAVSTVLWGVSLTGGCAVSACLHKAYQCWAGLVSVPEIAGTVVVRHGSAFTASARREKREALRVGI